MGRLIGLAAVAVPALALLDAGFAAGEIEKVMGLNALRVLSATLARRGSPDPDLSGTAAGDTPAATGSLRPPA